MWYIPDDEVGAMPDPAQQAALEEAAMQLRARLEEKCSDCRGQGGTMSEGPCPSCFGEGVLPVRVDKNDAVIRTALEQIHGQPVLRTYRVSEVKQIVYPLIDALRFNAEPDAWGCVCGRVDEGLYIKATVTAEQRDKIAREMRNRAWEAHMSKLIWAWAYRRWVPDANALLESLGFTVEDENAD